MRLENVYKDYYISNNVVHVLKDINVEFNPNNFYAIMGRSGSGKTTLVNILGLLDECTSGEYFIDGINMAKVKNSKRAEIIGQKIGFVFQSFYLNDNLSALENVMLPLYINDKIAKKERKNVALQKLFELGLKDRINHKPKELSGGEQ